MIRLLVVCVTAFAMAAIADAQAPTAQRPDPRSVKLRGDRFKPLTYDEMTPAQKTMIEQLFVSRKVLNRRAQALKVTYDVFIFGLALSLGVFAFVLIRR